MDHGAGWRRRIAPSTFYDGSRIWRGLRGRLESRYTIRRDASTRDHAASHRRRIRPLGSERPLSRHRRPRARRRSRAPCRAREALFRRRTPASSPRRSARRSKRRREITSLADQLFVYLYLRRSTDATNERIQQRLGAVQEAWSRASADYLTFFEHELVAIDDATYAAILERDPIAARHRPLLDHIRANRRFLLTEPVERALTLRSPFGPSEWSDYIDEMEAELRFDFDHRPLTLPEILHVVSNDRDARAARRCAGRVQRRPHRATLRPADGARVERRRSARNTSKTASAATRTR